VRWAAKLARSSRCKSGPVEGGARLVVSVCAGGGSDTAGEAYTAIELNQLLRRESGISQGPRPPKVGSAESNMNGAGTKGAPTLTDVVEGLITLEKIAWECAEHAGHSRA